MKRDLWVLTGLIVATFLSLVHYLSYSPLLPAIATDLQIDVGQLGQMPAAIGLGAALVGLVAGPLADRYGKRRMLLGGVFALVLSSAGLAFLPSLAALALIAAFAAVGRATVYPLALAIASAEYNGDEQRQAVSRITSSLAAAPILGVPLVTAVASAVDWRAAWLALSVVTVVVLAGLARVFRSSRAASSGPTAEAPDIRHAYSQLIRHRPSLALLGVTFMMGAGGWGVWTYLGAFVVQQHGFSTQEAGWAWVVVGIGLFAGTVLAGGRLGSASLEVVLTVAAVGTGILLGAGLLFPLGGWQAVALIGAGTLLHGVTQVVTAVLLPQAAPTGRGATMTLRGGASSLGGAVGAASGGLILGTAGFPMLGAITLVYCVVAAGLAWWTYQASQPKRVARPRLVLEAAEGQ